MRYLADTNILLRSAEPSHPMHPDTVAATSHLLKNGEELYVFPQNLIEFWAVATRPASANGLGMTTAQAETELARIKSLFRLLPDTPEIYSEWETLVVRHGVSGKNTHDARIVAAMIVHGMSDLLTFNTGDFKRYPGLISCLLRT
ncbi:MAG TPA: type II toxin-antitoxin system VapC family toxin [Blastocatellia bacterium]